MAVTKVTLLKESIVTIKNYNMALSSQKGYIILAGRNGPIECNYCIIET